MRRAAPGGSLPVAECDALDHLALHDEGRASRLRKPLPSTT